MGPRSGTIAPRDAVKFRRLLLRWFQKHQRKLPWRGESDAYRILVSEIMLQQTRVAVVEDRYRKFVAQFPTAEKLARAKEATVLAAWSGLGYYRRARALHRASKEIVKNRGFPGTAADLMELPGVGRYTAAAVASIAFGEPVAVVDGNVKRVLDRVVTRKGAKSKTIESKTMAKPMPQESLPEESYWQIAGALLDQRRPGDFNQAMMELGALVCLPAQPLCESCPVSTLCASRGPLAKAPQQARRKAELHYSLVRRNGSVLLQQRPQASSLMPGMWELPACDAGANGHQAPLLKLRHSITTTDYTVFVHIHATQAYVTQAHAAQAHTADLAVTDGERSSSGRWVPLRSIHRLPLTGLTRKIIERLEDV